MILSSNITMYLDDVPTPLHEPAFGMSHSSAAGSSFEEVLAANSLNCLTITDKNSGSTRASIETASVVKFKANTDSGVVEINGSVYQVEDAFGGTHFSVIFLVS